LGAAKVDFNVVDQQRDAVDILIPSLLQENAKLRDPRIFRYLYVETFVEVSPFKEKLEAEFQGDNDDFYLAEAIVATNAK